MCVMTICATVTQLAVDAPNVEEKANLIMEHWQMSKTCTIRIKKTGEIIVVKSYGFGWIDSKGKQYHRTQAELVNVRAD